MSKGYCTETQQLQELKDYTDKLFQKEGGRGNVLSFGGAGGMHNESSKLGPLHPSFCQVCGKCYYEPRCFVGYLAIAENVLFNRFLEKVNGR